MASTDKNLHTNFGELLRCLNNHLPKRYWFRLTNYAPGLYQNSISLKDITGLPTSSYEAMLKVCSLVGKQNQFKRKQWELLFDSYCRTDGYQYRLIPKRDQTDNKDCWFVELGPEKYDGYDNPKQQVTNEVRCPRLRQLNELKSNLRDKVSQSCSDLDVDVTNNGSADDDESVDVSEPEQEQHDISQPEQHQPEQSTVTPHQVDVSKLSDGQIKLLLNQLAKEQLHRKGKSFSPFQMMSFNQKEWTCIPVPDKHKSDQAFEEYQKRNPYVRAFCTAVGGGDLDGGVKRVMDYLASRYPELYEQCGLRHGLSIPQTMDADALAAMAVDCNLKQWQLLKVLKYMRFATGCRISDVTVKEMEAKFSKDMVVPETGKFEYITTKEDGNTATEIIEYDYQSIVDVFNYVVAQKLMEKDVQLNTVEQIGVGLGGDHGVGAFRLNLTIIIVVRVGDSVEQQFYKMR